MAAEIAPLGFDIDTSALVQGAKAADALANSLNNVANATDKVDGKSAEAAAEVKKVAEAEKQAAISAEQLGKAVVQAVTAMTKEQEAAKQAAEAIKKKEEADKKAAAAAKKAAEEEAMRSTIMGRMALAMREMQGAAANSNQHVEKLTGHMSALGQTLQAGGGGLQGNLSSAAGLMSRFATTLGPVGGVVLGVTGGVAALGAAYVGLSSHLAEVQDRFALLEGRLKNVYGSGSVAKQVFSEISVLANKNAISIEGAADAFLRLARNNEAIGLTRKQTLELTDAVQMLGRVSGATTGELASGMLQFSQSLASGRLNGDELRSIMENMPALAKAIAQGMGVSVGQMRALGAAGELTGDKITKALLGQLPKIKEEFENLPTTTEQAFTRVDNAWSQLLANMGQRLNSSGFMQSIARATEGYLQALNNWVRVSTTQELIDQATPRKQGNPRGAGSGITPGYANYTPAQAVTVRGLNQGAGYEALNDYYDRRREADTNLRAPFVASGRITEEIDPVRKRVQEIKSNIQTLETVLENFKRARPGLFEPQEVEQINRYSGYIAQLKKQLEDALPPLEKFQKATSDRISDAIKYGYQATGFAGSVRKLTSAGVSEPAAVGAVTQDAIVSTNAETDAIQKQIEAQQKRIAAIGQGKAAEREAEASAKALEYQYRTFGIVIGADAKAAVEAYKNALLGLSAVQDAAAAKQAMLNAQIDLAAAKAGAAAAAAGGGAGAVAEAQRNARRAGQLATADDPASMAVRFAAEDIDRRTGEAAQLRTVRTSTAMQRRIAGGMSPADARRAAQEQEARQFSEGFSSAAAREVAYQEKLNELRARDAANSRKQMDEREAALSLMEKQTELTKTGSLEERVALARAREMNAIRQEGVSLSQAELDARLRIAENEERAKDKLDKAQQAAQRYKQTWDEIGQAVTNSLDSAFDKLLNGQKIKFKEFAKDLMKEIAMILIKAQITGPLAQGISTMGQNFAMPSAFGNVFSGGHLTMMAAGGIVASPTLFPMARGAGLMGEAGPEAVLPLKRGPDGRLGVASGASNDNGVQVVVNDMRGGGERVQTEEERGPDGKRFIRLTIRDEVKGQIKGGTYDPEMSSQYGARRVLARR